MKNAKSKYLNDLSLIKYQLSFQKYKTKSLKHYNKMNKIFEKHVENKSKGQLSQKGC